MNAYRCENSIVTNLETEFIYRERLLYIKIKEVYCFFFNSNFNLITNVQNVTDRVWRV